jgi:hypothetical protein
MEGEIMSVTDEVKFMSDGGGGSMKAKGVNWKNWAKLLEFLKTRRPKQVNMRPLLRTDVDSVVLLRKVNPKCGTVGCIAGWAGVLWGTDKIIFDTSEMVGLLGDRLRLSPGEVEFIVVGRWGMCGEDPGPLGRESMGKRAVIRYMTNALKERNVMVSL